MRLLTRIHVIIAIKTMWTSFTLTSSANRFLRISQNLDSGIWFLADVAHLDNWQAIYLFLKSFMHSNHVFIKINIICIGLTMWRMMWKSIISSKIYLIFSTMRFPSEIWNMWNRSMTWYFQIYGLHFWNLRGW